MASPPRFKTVAELEASAWNKMMIDELENNSWPTECVRCQQAEQAGFDSVRVISNKQHDTLTKIHKDYLVVDVVVDTICNAACPICSADLSSTIAKLEGIPINPFDGISILETIPRDRIVQLDILGGEPGASKRSQQLLQSLADFPLLQKIHISTNGSMQIKEIERLLENGVHVDLVISMDGTEQVFEYCRFPLEWNKFAKNVKHYKQLQKKYSNLSLLLWSSISALCVSDLPNMLEFAHSLEIPFNGAPIQFPEVISIGKTNHLTSNAKEILTNSKYHFANKLAPLVAVESKDSSNELEHFLTNNDAIRKINYRNFIK